MSRLLKHQPRSARLLDASKGFLKMFHFKKTEGSQPLWRLFWSLFCPHRKATRRRLEQPCNTENLTRKTNTVTIRTGQTPAVSRDCHGRKRPRNDIAFIGGSAKPFSLPQSASLTAPSSEGASGPMWASAPTALMFSISAPKNVLRAASCPKCAPGDSKGGRL